MPEAPEGGLLASAKYFVAVVRARFQRRAGMRNIAAEIQSDVGALDGVLGSLGRSARAAKLELRPLVDENQAIDAAETRRLDADRAREDLTKRLEEEQRKFATSSSELGEKLAAAEKAASAASTELARQVEIRRETREKKKEVDRRQRNYLKGAEDREKQAEKTQAPEQRAALRRSAEDLRIDAARLEPERSDLEKALAGAEEAVTRATAVDETARADLQAARKTLEDARAGHDHRRGELEAEMAQKNRVTAEAAAEVGRRLVTLGTLFNLNRIPGPDYDPFYQRVDGLKATIAAREKEIEKLRLEAATLDRAAALRGAGAIAGALVILITAICVLIALL
jgi:chromosome segregation ATPase